jgi:hypothetical protein
MRRIVASVWVKQVPHYSSQIYLMLYAEASRDLCIKLDPDRKGGDVGKLTRAVDFGIRRI